MSTKIRHLLLLCATLLVSQLAAVAAEPAKTGAKPKANITVAKDTTKVTGPLTDDGYVDYARAINQRLGKGVTQETNANVLLWQAMGPHPEETTMPPEFFKLMEIPTPKEDGDYFLDLTRYLTQVANITPDDPLRKKIVEQHHQAQTRPWASKQYPQIAAWLKANEGPLRLVVQGTRRPKYYSPLVVPHGKSVEDNTLAGAPLPVLQQSRSFARALSSRAMLHVGEGRFDAAWQDLLASHRLARLVGQGATLYEGLVGIAIEGVATRGDLALLEHAKPNASQVAGYLNELASLAPLPDVTEKIDVAERFTFLDMIQMLARNGGDGLKEMTWEIVEIDKLFATPPAESIDWDVVLRIGNQWYDRVGSALRNPSRAEMQQALDGFEADLHQVTVDAKGMLLTRRQVAGPSKVTDKAIGDLLIGLTLPAVPQARVAEDQAVQMSRNLRVAFALAAYRSDHGAYPDALDQLHSKYLREIPDDLFSGRALIYRPLEDGYLLYSVGHNGKDDGGRWFDDEPTGDDPNITMPPRAVKVPPYYAAPSPGPIASSGIAVTAETKLKVDQEVQVESGDEWWAGKVLMLLPDGRAKIHYVGWDSSWDEEVPRSRLQLPSKPRQ